MSDLFTRLAQRARAEAVPSTLAETEPEPGRWTGEDDQVIEPAPTPPLPTGTVTPAAHPGRPPAPLPLLPGSPGPPGAPGIVGRDGATGIEGPDGLDGRHGIAALLPVPSVIPPARGASAPIVTDGVVHRPSRDARPPAPAIDRPSSGDLRAGPPGPPPSDSERTTSVLRAASPPHAPPIAAPPARADHAAAPAVEVTVGRLEIRVRPPAAVTDADAPRRSAAPAPALTLGEYLRRRESTS